MSGKRSTVF